MIILKQKKLDIRLMNLIDNLQNKPKYESLIDILHFNYTNIIG